MEQFAWIAWIVLGICLIIAETFTLGFVLLWFGVGALAAAFIGFLGVGFSWQFLIFAVISIVLTALSRTIFSKYYAHDDKSSIKTGIDSLPGQIGIVTGASKGALQAGEVKVYGSTWTAFLEDGQSPLIEGEKVEVLRVQGSSIYVRRMNELPEWRSE
jgi:membrane protein implicated in regulation of membrane protease activity